MNENTKCSKCGSEDIKKVITNSSFTAGPENYTISRGSTPIYVCNKCGNIFNDFLDVY
ncbi:hypothetical protein ACJDU8_03070 [Clostridium sp. WILCCON 0269]|uniref:Transcription initiation factor TFIIIB n=1 Tax=Candidatus Clostridium eludens TaxID=3381663 RepID=A0ABW8SF02_9CLOT